MWYAIETGKQGAAQNEMHWGSPGRRTGQTEKGKEGVG